MTIPQIKEFLNRARYIDTEIKKLSEERAKAFDMATSITTAPNPNKVQSGGGNSTERNMIKYAEYSELIDKRIEELINAKTEIMSVINAVPDSTSRMLLLDRYIKMETWEQVALDMHYSYVHVVHSLHPRALEQAAKAAKHLTKFNSI